MSGRIVRITRNLSFDQVQIGAVTPIEAYKIQVSDWIIGPARVLASQKPRNTDHGMAILALELMFFEPHGEFLDGSLTGSKKRFCAAFDRFRSHLNGLHRLNSDVAMLDSEKVYKWARCGLFHSSLLATDLLVDAVGFSGRPLAKNPILPGWLVDPWLLLQCLEDYLKAYVEEVQQDKAGALATQFNNTFTRLFSEPIKKFSKS